MKAALKGTFGKSVGAFIGGGCQRDWEAILMFSGWEPGMAYNAPASPAQ